MSKYIYYTAEAVAQELGVSVKTVHRLKKKGKIKSVKRGKQDFFLESEIDRLIKNGWS